MCMEKQNMKVLVAFWLPDGTVATCKLAKLTLAPRPGCRYLLAGKLYDVVDSTECLGAGDGNTQLVELLKLVSDETGALPVVREICPEKTGGESNLLTISRRSAGLAAAPEGVLLVRLKAVPEPAKTLRLFQPVSTQQALSSKRLSKQRGRAGKKAG